MPYVPPHKPIAYLRLIILDAGPKSFPQYAQRTLFVLEDVLLFGGRKMFCTECGYKLEDDFKFCPNCGIKLMESEDMDLYFVNHNMDNTVYRDICLPYVLS